MCRKNELQIENGQSSILAQMNRGNDLSARHLLAKFCPFVDDKGMLRVGERGALAVIWIRSLLSRPVTFVQRERHGGNGRSTYLGTRSKKRSFIGKLGTYFPVLDNTPNKNFKNLCIKKNAWKSSVRRLQCSSSSASTSPFSMMNQSTWNITFWTSNSKDREFSSW